MAGEMPAALVLETTFGSQRNSDAYVAAGLIPLPCLASRKFQRPLCTITCLCILTRCFFFKPAHVFAAYQQEHELRAHKTSNTHTGESHTHTHCSVTHILVTGLRLLDTSLHTCHTHTSHLPHPTIKRLPTFTQESSPHLNPELITAHATRHSYLKLGSTSCNQA